MLGPKKRDEQREITARPDERPPYEGLYEEREIWTLGDDGDPIPLDQLMRG